VQEGIIKAVKKRGGIKAHILIKSLENMHCLKRDTGAVTHDHILLQEINLAQGSIILLDKGAYAAYEQFTTKGVWYVTKLKIRTLNRNVQKINIPDTTDNGILIDEINELRYSKGKELVHTES